MSIIPDADRSLYVPQKLDIKKMKLASEYLIGEHDFSSFRGSGCQSKTPIRDIQDIKISRSEQFINVELKANAFLLHMVRIIIGTLLTLAVTAFVMDRLLKVINKDD